MCVCHEMSQRNNSKTVLDIQMISAGFKQTKGGLSDGITFAPLIAPNPIFGVDPHNQHGHTDDGQTLWDIYPGGF